MGPGPPLQLLDSMFRHFIEMRRIFVCSFEHVQIHSPRASMERMKGMICLWNCCHPTSPLNGLLFEGLKSGWKYIYMADNDNLIVAILILLGLVLQVDSFVNAVGTTSLGIDAIHASHDSTQHTNPTLSYAESISMSSFRNNRGLSFDRFTFTDPVFYSLWRTRLLLLFGKASMTMHDQRPCYPGTGHHRVHLLQGVLRYRS